MTAGTTRRAERLAMLCMIGSAAGWGSATVLTKGLLETVPAFSLLAVQLSASFAALLAAVLVQGRLPRHDRRVRRAGLAGLLEPGLAYGVGVPGVALTTAGSASLIAATEPALVCIVAWLLLAQRPTARLGAGIAVAVLGVVLVSLGSAEGGERRLAGDALVLLGTVFAALYVVVSSRQVRDIPPLDLVVAQQGVALVFVLGMLAVVRAVGWEPEGLPQGRTMVTAVFSGVLQYALPFWLYLRAVRHLAVSRAAVFLTLTPVFGNAGGTVFLGEPVTALQIGGAAAILAAIVHVARQSDAHHIS